jgi:hypothetical protein
MLVLLESMIENRPKADRILIARLAGTTRRLAGWNGLAGDEEAVAVAELRELAAGRADLLGEAAGLGEGFSEGKLDEPLARQAAALCRKAGADLDAVPGWIGRRAAPEDRGATGRRLRAVYAGPG